ncbi:uncharacterized protein LOC124153994 isoform X2 [Ischnura elegans]|uniref:uncharacterized protein LOC124153994 isoform X2 n=1 Tax=Ischnura elegans TaxID=197161 RepID=UPI001ED896BE|nr:uncharacterized protein LOC124153994 isoform X2 [Ischnura elegans]
MEKINRLRISVTGVIIAISHVFSLPGPEFYIKIFQRQSICIKVTVKEHFNWLTSLKIGVTYRFSKLVPKEIILYTGEAVQYADVVAESVVQEVQSVFPLPLQEMCLNAVSCTDIVADDSFDDFGLYKLRGGATLCTAFIAHMVNMENFRCMNSITIYNAHDRNVDGTKYYVMCAGSYAVSQLEYSPVPKKPSYQHPVIGFVLEKGWGFEDFLWLIQIFSKLKGLFDGILMLHDEMYRKCVLGILNNLMLDDPVSSDSIGKLNQIFMKEFLNSNHECAALAVPKHLSLDVLTIEDFRNLLISSEEASDMFWSHKSLFVSNSGQNGTKCVIVGKLSIAEESTCLMLSDGVSLIRCILVGRSDNCSNIKSYVNNVVIVREAFVVMEEFRSSNSESGVSFEKEYLYVFLSPDDIHPICDASKNDSVLPPHTNECTTSRKEQASCTAENLSVDGAFLSQHVLIHHVSIPMIYENTKQFYCLVSLLGRPVESDSVGDSATKEFKEEGRLCILCMKKHMFQVYPFLYENRVYAIRYPRSHGVHLFDKRVRDLPDVPFRDVVHVQGVLVFRSHQTTKYPRKRKLDDHHYGVPLQQNIIVEMRDEESDSTIRIYLIALTAKLYPVGLLPGSLVCIKFIEKRISAQNKVFYQSTCFTSIQIMEHCRASPVSAEGVLWDWSKRHSYISKESEGSSSLQSPFWGIFNITKVWKFEVVSLCRACNSRIRYGRCTYVGCSNLLKDPMITANANFSVEDGSGEAFMSAKDENVRKLFDFSPSEWEELGAIATRSEVIFSSKKYSQQSAMNSHEKDEDANQSVFNRLSSDVGLKPWHILCRKFVNNDDGNLRLFCLDVKEIDLARVENLCS